MCEAEKRWLEAKSKEWEAEGIKKGIEQGIEQVLITRLIANTKFKLNCTHN